MPVTLSSRVRNAGIDTRALRESAQRLLETIGEGGATLSLSLVRYRVIREITLMYRGMYGATDVLSFGLYDFEVKNSARRADSDDGRGNAELKGPPRLLGDVVISVDTALRQAADYGATLDREIARLLIHGILHLVGYDHERPDERARMRRAERRLAAAIALPWPY
jgi:probable rRNA maturation factor